MIDFDRWRRHAEDALRACEAHGGDAQALVIEPPASRTDVEAVEAQLGAPLPGSFRRVLLEFSAKFELAWSLPSECVTPFQDIFRGGVYWDLEHVVQFEEGRRGWVTEVFPNEEDAYDRVWHHKLGIEEVGNGDVIALDIRQPGEPMTYLSHDDGEGHGYVIGESFEDAIDRRLRVGGVGPEDCQWLPFTATARSGLDPDGANARQWRTWFLEKK